MSDLNHLGPKGEDCAVALLKQRGHRLLERNYNCPRGELDIITWHNGTLVFSEVRTRTRAEGRSAAESVTPRKQERVRRAAQWYLGRRANNRMPPAMRFDVVWFEVENDEIVESGVIEGAFTA